MKYTLIFIMIISLLSCEMKEKESSEEYIAKVNNEKISLEEFESCFSKEEWQKLNTEEKKEALYNWVDMTVLAQEADKIELSDNDVIKMKIEAAIKKIKANALIAQKMKEVKPTEEEIFNYYKANKTKYTTHQKQYKLQQIVVNSAEDMEKVKREINSKEKFADVASKYSVEKTPGKDGVIGFVSQADINQTIWQTLETLQMFFYSINQIGDKHYMFRYIDVRETDIEKDYQTVKEEIVKNLIEEKKQDVVDSLINELKQNSEIVISL